jgi:hypothetical protein
MALAISYKPEPPIPEPVAAGPPGILDYMQRADVGRMWGIEERRMENQLSSVDRYLNVVEQTKGVT